MTEDEDEWEYEWEYEDEDEDQSYDAIGEPDFKFVSELPHPQHSRVEKAFIFRRYWINYYSYPKSFGEIVAGMRSIYKYPQVAVVELRNEPILVVRSERAKIWSSLGTFLCSVTRNGDRANHGKLTSPETDADSFLQMVVEVVSRFDERVGR